MAATSTRFCPACNTIERGAKRKQPVLSPITRRFIPDRTATPPANTQSAALEQHIEWWCERCGFSGIEDVV